MAWTRLPLDRSTVAKCGIAAADLDEIRLAIQERIDYLKAVTEDDAFTNGFIHANRWAPNALGQAPTEAVGLLQCAIPDLDLAQFKGSAVWFNFERFPGDFDVQVAWSYAAAKKNVNCMLEFVSPTDEGFIGRQQTNAAAHIYIWDTTQIAGGTAATAATVGTFRLTRVGTRIRGYTDGVLRLDDTHAGYAGDCRIRVGLRIFGAKVAGWGGDSCTFDNFAANSGTLQWLQEGVGPAALADIALTDVSQYDEVWPVAAINSYRAGLEDVIPYFFTTAAGTARYTKATCLNAAFGQNNWRNEPDTPTLGDTLAAMSQPAWKEHINDLKAVCDKCIFLPLDSDSVDGFGNPGWTYEA